MSGTSIPTQTHITFTRVQPPVDSYSSLTDALTYVPRLEIPAVTGFTALDSLLEDSNIIYPTHQDIRLLSEYGLIRPCLAMVDPSCIQGNIQTPDGLVSWTTYFRSREALAHAAAFSDYSFSAPRWLAVLQAQNQYLLNTCAWLDAIACIFNNVVQMSMVRPVRHHSHEDLFLERQRSKSKQ